MKNSIMKQNEHPATLTSVFDDIFQNSFNRFYHQNSGSLTGPNIGGRIPVNIRETDESYLLELFAPGRRKEDFTLSIDGDLLTVAMNPSQKQEGSEQKGGWIRREYDLESFSRTFTCDDTIDYAKVSARYENGVLELTLPKKEGVRQVSRSIAIQ